MHAHPVPEERRDIDVLHQIGQRIAAADPLNAVLKLVAELVSSVVKCDSCFIYVLDGHDLVLRASQKPHADVVNRLTLRMGQGITGWVAEHKQPVAISNNASLDPRFQAFHELPEDRYEAFLSVPILCRDKLVGVINAQHREPYAHEQREIHLLATIGFLVGPEIESVRTETESAKLSELAEARQLVERAKQVLRRLLNVSEEEAKVVLSHEGRERRKSMKEIAEAILLSDEIVNKQTKPHGLPPETEPGK